MGQPDLRLTYCECNRPVPQPAEGVMICGECGERVADPLIVTILGELRALRCLLEDRPAEPEGLISAAEAARRLGVKRSAVYAMADELGAVPIGAGPKPRLRFDPRGDRGEM